MRELLNAIQLIEPSADLYDTVAENTAKKLANHEGQLNKSTQIRRFYDELIMWQQKIRNNTDAYDQFLPMIRMLNAKAAYALGRKLVDQNFVDLLKHCLVQLKPGQPAVFDNFCLFMEAFMGFYKMHNKGQ